MTPSCIWMPSWSVWWWRRYQIMGSTCYDSPGLDLDALLRFLLSLQWNGRWQIFLYLNFIFVNWIRLREGNLWKNCLLLGIARIIGGRPLTGFLALISPRTIPVNFIIIYTIIVVVGTLFRHTRKTMFLTSEQACKLGRCNNYLRNLKASLTDSPTHPLTGEGARWYLI